FCFSLITEAGFAALLAALRLGCGIWGPWDVKKIPGDLHREGLAAVGWSGLSRRCSQAAVPVLWQWRPLQTLLPVPPAANWQQPGGARPCRRVPAPKIQSTPQKPKAEAATRRKVADRGFCAREYSRAW